MGNSLTINEIIGIVTLVLLLLALSICFWTGPCKNYYEKFKTLIPGFGFLPKNQTEILILGYNVIQNKPKYYDGTTWQEFEKEIEYNGKKLKPSTVRKNFIEFFYDKNLKTREVFLSQKSSETIYPSETHYFMPAFYCYTLSSGPLYDNLVYFTHYSPDVQPGPFSTDLYLRVGSTCTSNGPFGKFIIYSQDKITFVSVDKKKYEQLVNQGNIPTTPPLETKETDITKKWPEVASEIYQNYWNWHSQIFKHPMKLEYESGEVSYYCVEYFPFETNGLITKLLKIDLSQEVSQNTTCKT